MTPSLRLADLLEGVGEAPLLLERNGVRYRLTRESADPWAGYEPKAVRAALAKTAGSWAELDADVLTAAVYRGREEGSRPPDRP